VVRLCSFLRQIGTGSRRPAGLLRRSPFSGVASDELGPLRVSSFRPVCEAVHLGALGVRVAVVLHPTDDVHVAALGKVPGGVLGLLAQECLLDRRDFILSALTPVAAGDDDDGALADEALAAPGLLSLTSAARWALRCSTRTNDMTCSCCQGVSRALVAHFRSCEPVDQLFDFGGLIEHGVRS